MEANICLFIQPYQIDPAQWKAVYEETVSILRYCCFMDSYYSEERKHYYACKTAHRENLPGQFIGGWQVHGDRVSGIQMPTVRLCEDIEYYRKAIEHYEKSGCVFKFAVNMVGEEPLKIWDVNPTSYELQLQLLAIAILICDRLPDATDMSSTATAEEVRQAVDWLEWVADRPVSRLNVHGIPDLSGNVDTVIEENIVAEVEYDIECGDYLRDYFPEDRIAPEIEARLIEYFREMYNISAETVDKVLGLTVDERRKWFDDHYSICIPKKYEDMIYGLLSNESALAPYIALYATEGYIDLHYAALCNSNLLKKYWELAPNADHNPEAKCCKVMLKNRYERMAPVWKM